MTTKRPIHQYSEAALADALKEIRHGMGLNQASRQFGVPRGTLQDRLKGRVQEGPRRMGPIPYLTVAEEDKLVEWCTKLAKCEFPRKETDILNTVQAMVLKENRKTVFKMEDQGRSGMHHF